MPSARTSVISTPDCSPTRCRERAFELLARRSERRSATVRGWKLQQATIAAISIGSPTLD